MEGLRRKKELCTNEAAEYIWAKMINKMINNVQILGLKKRGVKYRITMEYTLGGGWSE